MRAPRYVLPVLAVLPVLGCKNPPPPPPPTPASVPASAPASQPASAPAFAGPLPAVTASIAAGRLREHVYTLADDRMEGRGADTKGIHLAADYLERALIAAGVGPLFDQRYRQPFSMTVAIEVVGTPKLSMGRRKFRFGRDFGLFGFSGSGEGSGVLAFVGFGVSAKDLDYDDWAGIDAKDKVVVVLSGEPGDEDEKSPFDGRRRTKHSALRSKTLLAREAGAKALLIVREKLDERRRHEPASNAGIPTFAISAKTARALLGFDPTAAKKRIDESYDPESRVLKKTVTFAAKLERKKNTVENIGGLLKVDGATETVVLGAHYDHLGYGGGSDSLAQTKDARIHNGADDNASGTSVVLEVARALAASEDDLGRNVAFVLFAGEEAGLLGSSHFVKNSPIETEDIAAMINLDMVGRLRDEKLNVMGTKTASDWRAFIEEAVARQKLTGSFGGDGYGPSDHTSFYAAGVPVLFLFTGAHSDYHKPTDDPDTLDYQGMARVASVTHDLLYGLAAADTRPTYVKVAAPKPVSGGGGRGYGPYFGSIPDFGQSEGGVPFAGVREGSPADQAGVKKGDILIEFAGIKVDNLQDFTAALRRCAPGDEVVVKVKRDGEVIETKATLTRRGE